MTSEQVLQAVRAYCKAALSIGDSQCIVAQGPGVRPATAHVAVHLRTTRIAPGGHDGTYSGTVGSLTYTISDEEVSELWVTTYGASADGWADTLRRLWCTNGAAANVARAAGLSPGPASDVRDVSTNIDGTWEPRRQVTLTGYHRSTESPEAIDAISRIDVDADYQPGDNAVIASSQDYP